MKYWKELIVVLLLAIVFRFGPILLHGLPVGYDYAFHFWQGQAIELNGQLPQVDLNYPPLYHILLASLSLLSGLKIEFLAMIFFPLASVLLVLTVFLWALTEFRAEKNSEFLALTAALLAAIASPLIAAAFDSPENIALMLLPLALLFYRKKASWLSGLMVASFIFWNYLVFFLSFIALVVAHNKQKRLLAWFLFFFLGLSFTAKFAGFKFFEGLDFMQGMEFIALNIVALMPVIFLIACFVALPFILLAAWKRRIGFWFYWSLASFIGLGSIFFSAVLRAWEFQKFLTLGILCLIPAVLEKNEKPVKVFVAGLMVLLFCFSLIVSFQTLYPRVSQADLRAINFLEQSYDKGKILAEPSFSENIKIYSSLGQALLTGLYLEYASCERALMPLALRYLSSEESNGRLEELKARFMIRNFEDNAFRPKDFRLNEDIAQVYVLSYKRNCVFPLGKTFGLSCGENQTQILKTTYT